MDKDDYYLKDLDLCRQLEPILKKKQIEADSNLIIQEGRLIKVSETISLTAMECELRGTIDIVSTYRKDSLEAAIENLYYPVPSYQSKDSMEFRIKFEEYKNIAIYKRGQESLKSLAQLIILLDKEGVE